MNLTKTRTGRFHVGDWVSFRYGARDLIAQVVEARGPLGVNRRQLYRVRVSPEVGEPDSFELPEEELHAAPRPGKDAIIEHLKQGGLLKILRSGSTGGREQPRVWLTYTPRGGLTHTFIAERGIVGGAAVPFFAVHDGKVSAGQDSQQQVTAFLENFGLSPAEARDVLACVGSAA